MFDKTDQRQLMTEDNGFSEGFPEGLSLFHLHGSHVPKW